MADFFRTPFARQVLDAAERVLFGLAKTQSLICVPTERCPARKGQGSRDCRESSFWRLLKAGDRMTGNLEDQKKLIPKGLLFHALIFRIRPVARKLDRAVSNFIPGNQDLREVCAGELAVSIPPRSPRGTGGALIWFHLAVPDQPERCRRKWASGRSALPTMVGMRCRAAQISAPKVANPQQAHQASNSKHQSRGNP